MNQPVAISRVLYALSDPTRLEIVHMIHAAGELPCGACSEKINLSKPTMSHHFGILREAGILATRIEGTQKFNRIQSEVLNERFPGLLDAILASGRETTN